MCVCMYVCMFECIQGYSRQAVREGMDQSTNESSNCEPAKGEAGVQTRANAKLNIFAHSFRFVANTTKVLRQVRGEGGGRGRVDGQAGTVSELLVVLEGDAARQPFHQALLLCVRDRQRWGYRECRV
jgi:hypothetical protein